ncbi:aldolase/citrate lyase family protein [Xanthobacter agilis]|uniref:4-hydroxy-2-oxoheptanedioate aldolase n=1 Tax=Xanthobacter agilis TaxID=47492 RepID=A0ABU0LGW7_XANAG|nr:aldolase/citrate lyase family protein [Xanthobacter agilis]MDQ0506325.1 4-hydroxy-2-oxoheptanedioate aldolase [Xanthobacter agilis]
MRRPENPFKRALHAGRQQIGLWCSIPSALTAEAVAASGFDWLLIDGEHAPSDVPDMMAQLQAMARGTAHPVVRVPWNDPVIIKRVLDVGADTILVPMVQSAEEARAAVAATRYPPHGIRGFASNVRATAFGRMSDYFTRHEEEMCVLVQVETVEALEKVEEIAAVDGVDGVFIGPGDLSASMGLLNQTRHPDVVAAVEDGMRRILAAGNRPGILANDPVLARRYMAAGAVFTAVGIDVMLLVRAADDLARQFRE